MNTRLNTVLSTCLLAAPVVAPADVALEQAVTIEARGLISVFETVETVYTEISGDRARVEAWNGAPARIRKQAAIVNLDGDLSRALEPDAARYTTVGLGEQRLREARDIELISQVPLSGPDALPITDDVCQWSRPQVELERTGKRQKFAGIRSEQYLITTARTCYIPGTRQACDVTWVLDYWNARRMPGAREATDFRRGLADRLGTTELLAMSPLVPRGLLALFGHGWEEAIYEAEGLKGYPVKTVMSLHLGGKHCRNRSDREITRDTVWSRVKEDSIQATKNSAAATAGNVVAGQVFRKVGGNLGGMIAGGAADIYTRTAASRAMEREEKKKPPVQVGDEGATERVKGQVQIFRITTELQAVSEENLPAERFEIPADWREAPTSEKS
jgi:hypothetical protein